MKSSIGEEVIVHIGLQCCLIYVDHVLRWCHIERQGINSLPGEAFEGKGGPSGGTGQGVAHIRGKKQGSSSDMDYDEGKSGSADTIYVEVEEPSDGHRSRGTATSCKHFWELICDRITGDLTLYTV